MSTILKVHSPLFSVKVDIFDASSNLRVVREEYALYLLRIHPGTNLCLWYIRIPSISMYTTSVSIYIRARTHMSSLLYTEKWCSELSLLDAESLLPARVHCIIQFWSLAIKKRNKGRAIVSARCVDRGRYVGFSFCQLSPRPYANAVRDMRWRLFAWISFLRFCLNNAYVCDENCGRKEIEESTSTQKFLKIFPRET